MDIRYLSRRTHELEASSDTKQARQTVDAGQVAQTAQPSTAATSVVAHARLSPAGRLLHVLQSFEQRHPEQTRRVLGNIADKLRADAEHAGVFSARLTRWAERFQSAADSGDMSALVPRVSSHFGARAYQQAAQPEPDATVEHVADTAEAQSNAAAALDAENTAAGERVSGIRTRAVTVAESDVRNRPVTVPESATAEKNSADIRDRPVTVPESATAEKNSADIRNRPVTVPESSKLAVNQ